MEINLKDRISICENVRVKTSELMAQILQDNHNLSEVNFREKLLQKLSEDQTLYKEGWYSPPPSGVGVLFAQKEDYSRLSFTSLRNEEFWPKDEPIYQKESVGLLYASPVDIETGMIGDFAVTLYNGENKEIQTHMTKCLEVLEKICEYTKVGMEFKEVYNYSNDLLEEYNLNKSPIILLHDDADYNIGHTIPFSYENPTFEEQNLISNKDFEKVKSLIAKKRLYINNKEAFKIPETIAFTIEMRINSEKNKLIPNTYFHMIVSFVEGEKKIFGNFEPIFKSAGMDFIKSKY